MDETNHSQGRDRLARLVRVAHAPTGINPGVVEGAVASPKSHKNYRCARNATAVEGCRSKGEMGSQEPSTMNAQPEENERSKAGIVLQAAEHGSGGSGIRVPGSCRLLVDIDRNLRSTFLDSFVYAERAFCMGRQVRSITQNMHVATMINGFGASAAVHYETGISFNGHGSWHAPIGRARKRSVEGMPVPVVGRE